MKGKEYEQRNLESGDLKFKGYAYFSDLKFRGRQEILTHFQIYRKGNPIIAIGEINIRYRGIGFPSGEPRPNIGCLFKRKKYSKQFTEEALQTTLNYVFLHKKYSRAFIHVPDDSDHVAQALKLQEAFTTTSGEYVSFPPRIKSEPYCIFISEFLELEISERKIQAN